VWVSPERFMERVAAGGFVEWNEFAGNGQLYGTPTMEPPIGSDVVLEIDPQGAMQIMKRYPDAVLILVGVPSREEQARRLRLRGDDETNIEKRLALAAEEESLGRQMAGHVVVNDDVDRASQELAAIVDLWRQKSR
jgi:guanylate kinase